MGPNKEHFSLIDVFWDPFGEGKTIQTSFHYCELSESKEIVHSSIYTPPLGKELPLAFY